MSKSLPYFFSFFTTSIFEERLLEQRSMHKSAIPIEVKEAITLGCERECHECGRNKSIPTGDHISLDGRMSIT